jgi:hypothetical protein
MLYKNALRISNAGTTSLHMFLACVDHRYQKVSDIDITNFMKLSPS